MYLLDLTVDHLKLFAGFNLSFRRKGGEPRLFTAIIGPNGSGKTSLLQAIALCAAGSRQVNTLARDIVGHVRDRRGNDPLQITASFGFSDLAFRTSEEILGIPCPIRQKQFSLLSTVSQPKTEPAALSAKAEFRQGDVLVPTESDPLDQARSQRRILWFVSAYGVARTLPDAGQAPPKLDNPGIERMASLFPNGRMVSTLFANYFAEVGDRPESRYAAILKRALKSTEVLLPRIGDFELRGRGGVRSAGELQERHRWAFQAGANPVKLPAIALSHGYQSTIAWVADLIGHFLLEIEDNDVPPSDLRGLVLIDELDLYLHPTWQAVIVDALKATFPKVQFVVTTHTPVLLASLQPDEIVRLDIDRQTGNIVQVEESGDPRLMTGTEILGRYFGLDDIHPSRTGQALRDYYLLAGNPYRSADEDVRLDELRQELVAANVSVDYPVEPRRRT